MGERFVTLGWVVSTYSCRMALANLLLCLPPLLPQKNIEKCNRLMIVNAICTSI